MFINVVKRFIEVISFCELSKIHRRGEVEQGSFDSYLILKFVKAFDSCSASGSFLATPCKIFQQMLSMV